MARAISSSDVRARPRRTDGFLPIGDYAAIGDGRTLALVGSDGSIDWMCLPDLDSPSVLGALLDPIDGGSFVLAPSVPFEARRAYLPQTNVLQTEYVTGAGSVRVMEALTIDTSQNAPWRELVRHVEGLSGVVPMQWRLRPRFAYGRESRDPVQLAGQLVFRHGALQVAIKSWGWGEPQVHDGTAEARCEVRSGEQIVLALLASDDAALPSPQRSDVERRLEATVELWREWVARTTYDGPFKRAVERSLLAIRLLADGRTGAIAAAGTTSLPEVLGGDRNYDYRFGWVRDLSFTVDSLLRVGMEQLSHASVSWLLRAEANTHPRVDPVYTLSGDVVRSQRRLPLPGYRGTAPVHLGNQAGSQLQLGCVGDLIETVWRYVECGHVLAPDTGERIADCVELLCSIWRAPDAGLWELDDRAQYTTSKLGCWTALDRVLALVDEGQAPPRHVERWRAERDRIREFIEMELWSDATGSYVMKVGSEKIDCGVLLAARRGFTDPKGERMTGTIRAIRRELHAGGPLFYRYSGMREDENAFLACSFWMAEALALSGAVDEASGMMEALVSLGGELGLYAEEMEPGSREMRGNLPQALTHLALISAADILDRCEQERSNLAEAGAVVRPAAPSGGQG